MHKNKGKKTTIVLALLAFQVMLLQLALPKAHATKAYVMEESTNKEKSQNTTNTATEEKNGLVAPVQKEEQQEEEQQKEEQQKEEQQKEEQQKEEQQEEGGGKAVELKTEDEMASKEEESRPGNQTEENDASGIESEETKQRQQIKKQQKRGNVRGGRPKFSFGMGGTMGAISYTESLPMGEIYNGVRTVDHVQIINGIAGYLHVGTQYNLLDTKVFYLSLSLSYLDEIRGLDGDKETRLATHEMVRIADWGPSHGQYIGKNTAFNSSIFFKLNIGANIGRYLTLYTSIGLSAAYFQSYSYYSYQPFVKQSDNDVFATYPLFGFGIEIRAHKHLGVKMELNNVVISKEMLPSAYYLYGTSINVMMLSYLTFALYAYI